MNKVRKRIGRTNERTNERKRGQIKHMIFSKKRNWIVEEYKGMIELLKKEKVKEKRRERKGRRKNERKGWWNKIYGSQHEKEWGRKNKSLKEKTKWINKEKGKDAKRTWRKRKQEEIK